MSVSGQSRSRGALQTTSALPYEPTLLRAVGMSEKAVSLVPTKELVNDHLARLALCSETASEMVQNRLQNCSRMSEVGHEQVKWRSHHATLTIYLGGDGNADEWWSTMSQRSPSLT